MPREALDILQLKLHDNGIASIKATQILCRLKKKEKKGDLSFALGIYDAMTDKSTQY